MRKLVTSTFVTLDGVMQAPGGPEEDDSGGFTSGGWSVNYWDDTVSQAMTAIMAKHPDLLLGRKTYEIFAGYWPTSTEPGADELNNAKKYVVSTTLDTVDWNNSTLVKGDVVKEIARLKELDGPELQVHGSSNLIQTLLKHNLIDEMHLMIFPVSVGAGKRFFGEGANPSDFKLLESNISGTGVIIATYGQRGELKIGSFASDATPS
jgi:dihydrofolate reductase